MSLTYWIARKALEDIERNCKTAKLYLGTIKRNFGPYAKEQGLEELAEVTKEVIQDYEKYLLEKGYTPATIHSYLAPICKAAGINMKDIEKPPRKSGTIVRGRGGEMGKRGRKEADNPRSERIVKAGPAIGIRKAEYRRLNGSDLITGDDGYFYIHVVKGKGGKEHLQRILPCDAETVFELFKDVGPDEYVFSKAEVNYMKKINMHFYRAEHAKKAYKYYADRLENEPEYREQLIEELKKRFDEFNIAGIYKKGSETHIDERVYSKAYTRFCKEMSNSNIYKTRGDNRKRCIEKGLPTEYNRLALLAVSVFHLSHWRNDVTVTNYVTA